MRREHLGIFDVQNFSWKRSLANRGSNSFYLFKTLECCFIYSVIVRIFSVGEIFLFLGFSAFSCLWRESEQGDGCFGTLSGPALFYPVLRCRELGEGLSFAKNPVYLVRSSTQLGSSSLCRKKLLPKRNIPISVQFLYLWEKRYLGHHPFILIIQRERWSPPFFGSASRFLVHQFLHCSTCEKKHCMQRGTKIIER